MRWRLAVQDYDFNVAYIPGKDNIIADAFSRLCPKKLENEQEDIQSTEAIASIASLIAYADNIVEWIPKATEESEKIPVQYYVPEEEVASFYALHTSVTTQTGKEPRDGAHHMPQDKREIIRSCHNHDIGHWGVEKTIELCQQIMDKDPKQKGKRWPQMRADINNYVRNCDTCNKMTEKKLTSHVNKYITADYGIMKCIAIDAIHMPK